MQVTSFAGTDVGKTRYVNEDAFYRDDDAGLYAVADGVGGSRAGERASAMFCEVLEEFSAPVKAALHRDGSDPDRRQELLGLVERIFQVASDRIYRKAERDPSCRGMATTGVVLAIGPAGAVLGHVGDSRAYLMRHNSTQRMTVDHTLAQEMLNQGLIKQSELETFPHRNVLARAVGQLPTVRVDTAWLDVGDGDTVFLCSDGLYNNCDHDLRELLEKGGTKGAIDAANARGGEDNITCVMVQIESEHAADDPDENLDTQSKLMCIQNLFLFRYLNEQELVRVLKIVYDQHYKSGAVVFKEGDPGDAMYLVFSGGVEVMKGDHHLTTISTGGHFGELAFMDGHPRSATVSAMEPTTLLTIKRNDFRALTRTDPVIASKLLWCFVLNMAGRLRDLSSSYVKAKGTTKR